MFMEQVYERLRAIAPPAAIATRVLRIALMPESECDARCAPIYKEHNAVQTTILAGPGDVQLHLKAHAETLEEAQALVDDLAEELEDELDERVYSTARRVAGADSRLLPADARGDTGRRGVMYRRIGVGTHHICRGKFAILCLAEDWFIPTR